MEHVRCNLCGADDAAVIYPSTRKQDHDGHDTGWHAFRCTHSGYGTHPPIVQCQRCGLVYTDPRPDGDDILKTYQAVEDPLYIEEREGRVLTFEHHLKPLERLTGQPDGRPLLDVGAYTGVFVEIAAQHGWDAWGIEPSSWAVKDIESLFARLMGPRWPWLMEMHIYYFSRHTLRAMLETCGFQVLDDKPQGRYLRLGYLMNRIGALMPLVGRPTEWVVTKLGLRSLAVPVNLGDLFTAYATKR